MSNTTIKVFSGTEITVNLLKQELEAIGIGSFVQNDYQSGITAGFSAGGPSAVDLFIQEKDFPEAKPIIEDFMRRLV